MQLADFLSGGAKKDFFIHFAINTNIYVSRLLVGLACTSNNLEMKTWDAKPHKLNTTHGMMGQLFTMPVIQIYNW